MTGELRIFADCSNCAAKNPEDLFFGTCIADLGNEFIGCANCIQGDSGETCDFCDFSKPVFVCLEQQCSQGGPGHEHILREWLDDCYKHVCVVYIRGISILTLLSLQMLQPPLYSSLSGRTVSTSCRKSTKMFLLRSRRRSLSVRGYGMLCSLLPGRDGTWFGAKPAKHPTARHRLVY